MFSRFIALILAIVSGHSTPAEPRVDHDGRPLPDGVVARLGSSRFVAPGVIKAVAVSPDGRRIATASGVDVHIWDAEKAQIQCTIKTPLKLSDSMRHYPHFRLKWSTNGLMLAILAEDGSLSLHDSSNGRAYWHRQTDRYSALAMATNHANWLGEEMHFLDGDRTLAIALDRCHVELWDVVRGAHIRTWNVDAEKKERLNGDEWANYRGVTFSPSGGRLVWNMSIDSKPYRSVALIYDTISGKLLREVKDLSRSRRTDLLDEGETLLLQSFPEDDEIPPTITIVSTADVARQIKLDVPKDHARDLEYHRRMEWRLRPLVFGKVLWLQDKFGLSRWDPKTGKLLDQLNPGFLDLAASADGKRIAASRGRRLYVGTTDGNLDALLKSNDFWDFPRRIAFQPDGTLMAWSETHQYPGGRVAVYDPRKGSQISSHVTPVRDRSGPRCMDPSLKVMAKYDKEGIAIIDLANSKQISRLQVDKKSPRGFNAIQVSADGKRVLTWESVRENPYRFRWFDVATGRELGRMDVPYREVFPAYGGYTAEYWTPIAWYAPDGSSFGYRNLDSRLTVVDCNTGKVERIVGVSHPMSWAQATEGWGRVPVWDYWKNPVNQLYFASSRESPLGSESAIFNRDGDLLRRFKLNRVLTFATSTNARVVASRHTSTFQFHETATGRKIGEFDSGVVGAYDTHISLSFDNKLFAIACTDTTILVWDIDRQLSNKPVVPAAKNTDDAEALWQQLGNVDPAEANPAMWALVRGPAPTLAVLGERLRPIRAPDSKQLQKLIAELDSGMFKERDSASRELAVIGEMALPSLRAALKNPASVEQRERIEKLIATLQDTVNVEAYLREVRALEVLERIGTAEAKKIVENMASGSTSALPTREAKLVLSRWR